MKESRPLEKEFVRQRFKIVKDRLKDPDEQIDRLDRVRLQREYRLLGKLLDQVEEGRISTALRQWRSNFGQALVDHKHRRHVLQQEHEAWMRLTMEARSITPEPAVPGMGAEITDENGYVWVIDDRYLLMMDDLIKRLVRWLDSAEGQ